MKKKEECGRYVMEARLPATYRSYRFKQLMAWAYSRKSAVSFI